MKTQKPIKNPRECAVTCLAEVERTSQLIPEVMAVLPFQLGDDDRNLAYELAYGTMRYRPGLDRLLASFCKPAKLPPKLRWLLLCSLYQLRFMRTPAYAVLDEANKLAVQMKFPGLKPLVNGVLRNAERQAETKTAGYDLQTWLLDPWLAELLLSQYGRATLDAWLEGWQERGTTAYWTVDNRPLDGDEPAQHLPHAFRRTKAIPSEAFTDHRLYVQNESSQAVAEFAAALAPQSVLDLCAAPGGKTCYLAAFAKPARLVANDLAGERQARLRENRERLGLNFELSAGDARTAEFSEPFDLVLLDAPCSGIGIIGRHPEIKLLKREAADAKLRVLQAELLAAAWRHVRPGGHLLYTVCSLDAAELPSPPAEAQVVTAAHLEPWRERLPLGFQGDHFYFSPSATFDGFRGMLLRKS